MNADGISKSCKMNVKLNKFFVCFQIKTLQIVLKTMRSNPVSARQSQQFMNELYFYSDIVQAIEQFQGLVNVPENEKIDAFVRYFGSRLSLNPHNKFADADAILLLESANLQNFSSPNRWIYFDRDEVLACLKVCTPPNDEAQCIHTIVGIDCETFVKFHTKC